MRNNANNSEGTPGVVVQPVVSPQRRKTSPLVVAMAAASSMGLAMAMTSSRGSVLMVDDMFKRYKDDKHKQILADSEALKKAQAKRERKALKKAMRANVDLNHGAEGKL